MDADLRIVLREIQEELKQVRTLLERDTLSLTREEVQELTRLVRAQTHREAQD